MSPAAAHNQRDARNNAASATIRSLNSPKRS